MGFGNASYGSLWYGSTIDFPGFLYKKNTGVGGRRNPSYGLICNKPGELWNKYTPGSGVGTSNVSARRAKMRLATSCNHKECGRFYSELGQNQIRFSRYTTN